MKDWNAIVTIYQDGFKPALRELKALGRIEPTLYHNVLIMKVDDPTALLEAIEKRTEESPALYDAISRVAPTMRGFDFQSEEGFEKEGKSIILEWSPRLAGRSFHVRLHRRGGKHAVRTPDMERLFGDALLEATAAPGTPGSISFTDPDAVIAIDTIDDRAGLALWTREDLAHHRLLRPD
jgi:tRNA(Ser,Leu) C12 N-acetylase TAN1